ncbi:MAG: TRAP transporter permease [Alphaproteobacteria bacterium]|nr:TRAP transporter permease [Alphaproteobacteria bacterium]
MSIYDRSVRAFGWTVAVAMSLYHAWIAASGPPEAMIFRGTHLLFTLTLVFLLFPFRPREGEHRAPWYDLILAVLGLVAIGYIFVNINYFNNRIYYIDDLRPADWVMAILTIVLVLEATRRVIGLALPITAVVFLVYALLIFKVEPQKLLDQLYMTTEGIFGSTLGVSASYVIIFVLFGSFMERTGTGRLFMDFALALTGHTAGGPGKVAVVSSSLFGTISGSAVANVMVDGPITIPLMKKTGFRPPFAAAVEAVASTGGQIMPPVMGAAAFVMAEFLAVSYFQITLWAIIPAVLYYVAVFFSVHFEAKRTGLHGIPKSQILPLGQVMRERGHLFIPILIILAGMFAGYSAPLCALAGALSCFPVAMLRKNTRAELHWRGVPDALEDGAKNSLSVATACASAGIVIGVVTLTGLGITFTNVVVELARNSLLLALIVTACAGIILGMGMPTTPAYIIMVSLLVPSLIKLGAVTPAAHMFAFYFAILSAITPPVALAVYAAAALAKTDLWKAGWAAMRAGAAGFVVPFMFVYEPSLLMIGDWTDSAMAFVSASIGTAALAAALQGYMFGPASMWQRVVLFAAAILLIKPGLITDTVGLALLVAVALVQRLEARRAKAA